MLKTIGLSIAALSTSCFAVLLHAVPAAPAGLTIDITNPADQRVPLPVLLLACTSFPIRFSPAFSRVI
jgi:hypothetical protein